MQVTVVLTVLQFTTWDKLELVVREVMVTRIYTFIQTRECVFDLRC